MAETTEAMPAAGPPGPEPAVPEPHCGQERILALKGRFRVAICGRRFGKTVAAAIAAIRHCEHAGRPQRIWWISPVRSQSNRVERQIAAWQESRLKTFGKKAPRTAEWEHKRQEHTLLHVKTGSRIEFHSGHSPDRLRGAGLDLLILDEAADISEYTWKVVLKPMLLESQGEAYILGTPRGTNHWLHRLFLLGQEARENNAYASIRLPTRDNPLISPSDLDDQRRDMTGDEFRQEYEAEFIDGVDSVFTRINECTGGPALPAGRPGASYITGIDLGEQKDFTVLCSINCVTQHLEGFARFNNLGWHAQTLRILAHLQRFPGPCVVDATGVGDPIFQSLRETCRGKVEPFKFSLTRKEEIVRGLALGLDSRELRLAREPELIAELQVFTRLPLSGAQRVPRYGAPSGFHDDCVMALALGWWGLKKAGLWGGATANPLREGLFG